MLSAAKTPDNQTDSSLSLNSYEALELGDPYLSKIDRAPSRSSEEVLDLYDRLERSLEQDIAFYTESKTTARDVIEGLDSSYYAPLGEIGTFPAIPFDFSTSFELREEGKKWGKKLQISLSNGIEGHLTYQKRCLVIMAHPGQGETKENVCGTVKFAIICPNGDSPPELIYDSCDRWDCPVCYNNVLRETTARATERFERVSSDYSRAKVFKGDLIKHLRHWSISPPQDLFPSESSFLSDGATFEGDFAKYTPESYKRLDRWKRKLSDILKTYSKSFYGGAVTFHAHRKKHLDGSCCECQDCELDHVWEWGPHFHFIGYGNFRPSEEIYDKTGWVLHTIQTSQETNDKEASKTRSFSRTFFYIMSHATILSKSWIEPSIPSRPEAFGNAREEVLKTAPRNAYWWVGAYSSSNVQLLGIEKEREEGICDKCKTQRLVLNANAIKDKNLIELWGEARPYWIIHTIRHWAVKDEALKKWGSRYRMFKDSSGRWDSERIPEAWGPKK
jgi:hypothetical protein